MKWRQPRFLLPLLAVFLVLIVGIGIGVAYIRSSTSADITIVWQASTTSFTQQDHQDIQAAWKSALLSPNPSHIAGHEFTIMNAQRQGDWAIFSANERLSPSAQPIATEPLFFLAHLQGSTWTVWIPSSQHFCDQLMQVPNTLINATDKRLFC